MEHAPSPQRFEHRAESAAVRRQLIAHSERRSRLYRPCHDAFRFELPQVLPEHFDCYTWHGSPKLAKSESAITEAANNHWHPATINYPDCRVNGTPVPHDIDCTVFAHV